MNKEVISERQIILLISLFLFGDATMFVIGIMAKQDFWLSIIIAVFAILIMGCMYSRLHCIFPGRNLFNIIEICFGKYVGTVIILLYTLFTIQNISFGFHYVGLYITTVAFPETPEIILVICLSILLIWIVKSGIEVFGRFAQLFFPFIVGMIFLTILLLVPKMNINNVYPFLYSEMKPLIMSSFLIFTYPFGEIQVCAMIFSFSKPKKSIYKIYILSILITGIVLTLTSLTNVLVLGVESLTSYYFTSYATVAKLNIGNVLQRMEAIASIVFIVGSFFNVMVNMLAACKGSAKICRCEDYRLVVTPISLLVINLFYFQFDSTMDAFEYFFTIYPYYAVVFQVVLPIIIFLVAETKKKRFEYNDYLG